jgi:hypothetical protein
MHQDNAEKGIQSDFTLDDIRGAAAAIHIAGNNTVRINNAFRSFRSASFRSFRHLQSLGRKF